MHILLKGCIYMKKFIAILTVFILAVSLVACGAKNEFGEIEKLPVSGGSTEPLATDSTKTDDDAAQDSTLSTEAENKEESTPDEHNSDTVISTDTGKGSTPAKKPSSNKDNNKNDATTTTPESNTDNMTVLDFDDLISASNK